MSFEGTAGADGKKVILCGGEVLLCAGVSELRRGCSVFRGISH